MLLHCCVLLLLLPSLAKWQKTERVGGSYRDWSIEEEGSPSSEFWLLLVLAVAFAAAATDGLGTGAQEKWREGKKHTEFHTLSLGVRHFLLLSWN